jgi:hypothetical protein
MLKLADHFNKFREKLPRNMPREQALFAQACYLAGAKATFTILAAASELSQEDAVAQWAFVQQEISDAVSAPQEEKLVQPVMNPALVRPC